MDKYSLPMRVMHWLMALLIIILLAVGVWMTSLPNDYPDKFYFYGLHKSFGIVALVFVILRLSIRLRSSIPALPSGISKLDSKMASAGVLFLYIFMFVMPVSGYLMSTFGGHPVLFFGFEVPALFEKNPAFGGFFHDVHGYVGYTMIALITLHAVGGFKHLLVEKINIFRRMW